MENESVPAAPRRNRRAACCWATTCSICKASSGACARGGSTGQEAVRITALDDHLLVDDLDGNGLVRTGLDARGCFVLRQTAAAHVALTDDPELGIVLGCIVRAHQRAVLATEALV